MSRLEASKEVSGKRDHIGSVVELALESVEAPLGAPFVFDDLLYHHKSC